MLKGIVKVILSDPGIYDKVHHPDGRKIALIEAIFNKS